MISLVAWVSGLVFGFGLILAGMANPAKVLAFLDISGLWDPSLAFVMAGAIAIGAVAFALARNRGSSYLGAAKRSLHSFIWTGACARSLALSGIIAGVLSGLLGVGGGFVVVPALRKATGLDMSFIVSTSLAESLWFPPQA